jgi:hypothetical protein
MHPEKVREIAGAGRVPDDKPDLFGVIYTPAEIAKALKVSTNTVRRLFQDVEGVIKLGDPNPRGRRGYQTLRIPRAVCERILRERSR